MDFEYGPIPPERFDEVLAHLRHSFPDEPLNVSVGLCKHDQKCELLEEMDLMTLRDGLSVIAIDAKTKEVSGVRKHFNPLICRVC